MSTLRNLAADQSSNMQEVLCMDDGAIRPPCPMRSRVRDLGRTIKERGEVCQWIQHMTLEPAAPDPVTAAAFTNASRAQPEAPEKQTSGAEVAVGARQCGIGDSAEPKAAQRAVDQPQGGLGADPDQSAAETVISEERSLAEQLKLIREQQSQLMEKQRAFQVRVLTGCFLIIFFFCVCVLLFGYDCSGALGLLVVVC